jgi:hypothetical protein
LADGVHEVRVRIVDAAGNTGPVASATWTIDTAPPAGTVTVSSRPPDSSGSASASVAFTGAGPGESYECSVDAAAFAPCTSPWTASGLTEGAHQLRLRLADAVGNAGAITTVSWTVDLTAPGAAAITSAPSGVVTAASASVAFTVGAGETAQCRLDGAGWASCTSPRVLTGLTDGAHTFSVRAVDAAGNAGSADSRSWTVDTTPPPAPTFTQGPASVVAASSARIAFSSSEPDVGFRCRLDGGPWTACASPRDLTGLADGDHQFEVRARDTAGNDGPIASRTWTIDSTGPTTSPVIGNIPVSPTRATSASLSLAAGEPGVTFECSVDGAPFSACTSPVALSGLADGGHVVRVRQVDALGNPGPNASASWRVDTSGPISAPVVTGVPLGVVASNSFTAVITGEDGSTFECSTDGGSSWSTCASGYSRSGLADGTYRLWVRQLDPAGNPSPAYQALFTVDAAPPATPPRLGAVPPATSNPVTVFTFTGDGDTTFECRLDGGTWSACTSPFTTPALAEGLHQFSTRQVDAAGNVGPEDTTTWAVDTTAPGEVAISGVPSSPTSARSAAFTFTVEYGATLACLVDGATDPDTCTASPPDPLPAEGEPVPYTMSLADLPDGNRQVTVWQVDGAGNASARTTVRWTVDTTPPALAPAITERPARVTTSRTATIRFAGDAGTTSQCSLDGAPFTMCSSPVSLSGLADGDHGFRVRSLDASGNAGPASSPVEWTVDTTPPSGAAVITSSPGAASSSSVATFAFTAGPDGATTECSLDDAPWGACASPMTVTGIAPGNHTFRVRPVDAAGNVGANIATHAWEMFVPPAPPAGTTGITIASGASYATTRSVTVGVVWPAGARYMQLTESSDFTGVTPVPVTASVPWTLSVGASGPRTIRARFLDSAGEPMLMRSSSIILDQEGPSAVPGVGSVPAVTSSTTSTFTFTGDPDNTFECRVDNGAWAPCVSPFTTGTLAEGAHSFSTRQVDAAGNPGPDTTTSWTIDLTAPMAVGVAGIPASPTASRSAALTLTVDPGAAIRCQVDGVGSPSACPATPPNPMPPAGQPVPYTLTLSGLQDGDHQVVVWQVDAAGNASAQSTIVWTVDTVAPASAPVVGTRPANTSASATATFGFIGEAGTTSECSVDGAPFAPCASPLTLTGLADGSHTFRARSVDLAGNVGPASPLITWTVNTSVAPGGPPALIAGGDAYATSRNVVVNLNAPTGAISVELSNAADFSGAVRSSVSTAVGWALEAGPAGTRTVYVRFLDGSDAVVLATSDSILFDADPPVVNAITVVPADDGTVRVEPDVSDAGSGMADWQATGDTASPGDRLPASQASAVIRVARGGTVYVRAIDRAGNASAWSSRAVPVRAPAPAPPPPTSSGPAVSTSGATITASGDAVVTAKCASGTGAACAVRLTLLVDGRTVSTSEGSVGDGQTSGLRAALPKSVQATIARKGEIVATLRTEVSVEGAVTTTSTSITLRAPAARGVSGLDTAPSRGRRDAVTVAARCEGSPVTRCRGVAELRLIGRVPGKRANGATIVGSAPLEGPGGSRIGATVTLNAAGRRVLARLGSVPASLSVTLNGRTVRGPAVEVGTLPPRIWVTRMVGILDKYGKARATLNGILDEVHAGTASPQAGAARIRAQVLPRRRAALAEVSALAAPAELRPLRTLAMRAYEVSIKAGEATAGHLATGGMPTNDPNSPLHVEATRVKEALLAGLAARGRALGVDVPPARTLWP